MKIEMHEKDSVIFVHCSVLITLSGRKRRKMEEILNFFFEYQKNIHLLHLFFFRL